MMKLFYLLISYLLFIECLSAQRLQELPINISYFGDAITHPGIKVGVEYLLLENAFIKTTRSGKQFDKKQSLFVTSNLGFYHHRRFHTALFINSEIGYRKTKKKGFKAEVLIGAGLMRTFVAGNTYEVLQSGEIKQVHGAGQYGFMPSLSVGVGRDLAFTKGRRWAFHIKPSIYLQMPYNHTFLPHFVLETGVTYSIKRKD